MNLKHQCRQQELNFYCGGRNYSSLRTNYFTDVNGETETLKELEIASIFTWADFSHAGERPSSPCAPAAHTARSEHRPSGYSSDTVIKLKGMGGGGCSGGDTVVEKE